MARVRLDAVSAAAVDLARDAVVEVAGAHSVGDHLRARADGDRLVSHTFACLAKGYPGWEWTVTLARAPRAKAPTVCEIELMATDASVTAPTWVPWAERVAPGDLGPGDVFPPPEADERLDEGYAATGEEDVDQLAMWELGLGRRRVLSREGRQEACSRWQDGDFGPLSTMARQATQKCRECGFLMPLAGTVRQNFGVCTNAWSPADGRVISLDYGCGAHSEQEAPPTPTVKSPLIDDLQIDLIAVPRDGGADDTVADDGPAQNQPAQDQSDGDQPAESQPGESQPGEPVPAEAASEPASEPGAEVVLADQGRLQPTGDAPESTGQVTQTVTEQAADPAEAEAAQTPAGPRAADADGTAPENLAPEHAAPEHPAEPEQAAQPPEAEQVSLLDQGPLQAQLQLDAEEPRPDPAP